MFLLYFHSSCFCWVILFFSKTDLFLKKLLLFKKIIIIEKNNIIKEEIEEEEEGGVRRREKKMGSENKQTNKHPFFLPRRN